MIPTKPRGSNNRTLGWAMVARLEVWDADRRCFRITTQEFAGYTGERRRLWGCSCLCGFDAWWLPQLGSMNLIVPHESLDALRRECALAMDISNELSDESGCAEPTIRTVLQNFLSLI